MLIHGTSDKSRQKNIKKEISAGKDPKQAVAIGYSVQREAKKKRHKAHGVADQMKKDGEY